MRSSHTLRPARSRWLAWLALALVWLALLSFGLRQRFVYATTAGAAGTTPAQFPPATRLPLAPAGSTLLMFVHPQCPCTRASMQELADLLATPRRVTTQLIVAPSLDPRHRWADTPGAALVRDIAGLSVFADRDGVEARRFGAETSGYAVLYDATGKLLFAGGITGSRGHVGENVGLRELRGQLASRAGDVRRHAVYGCSLHDEAEGTAP